jgi:hypothetical protein
MHAVKTLPIDVIYHKFLIPGHTMMECDSMHSSIEYARKHLTLYTVNDWVNVLKSAGRHSPYEVNSMNFGDFFDLKSLATSIIISNRRTTTSGCTVNWLDIKWIRVEKARPGTILLKTDFDQPEFHAVMQHKRSRPHALKKADSKQILISYLIQNMLTSCQ